MKFTDIIKTRYATKRFNDKAIQQEKVDELIEIIRHTPSSYNIQPWKVLVITNKEIKKRLQQASYDQKQITTCSHLLVFCADINITERIDELGKLMIQNGATKEEIQGYIATIKEFEEELTEEEKKSWTQKQVYIALGNAINGATA